MSTDLCKMITEAFKREYPVYSCGFIKNRRTIYPFSYHKNWGMVAACYKKLKARYKSAFFNYHPPLRYMLADQIYAKNPILERLKKLDL